MKSLKSITDKQIFIIAEAGVNHNGDVELGKKLIEVAAEAGADAVKFQTWKTGECTGRFATKVAYLDTDDSESRFDISNKLMLPYPAFNAFKAHCEKVGIMFMSTPDGYESLNFLVDELNLDFIKISSTEVTHIEYLKCIARKNRPVILSTGMSKLGEVEEAIYTLEEHGAPEIFVLHCTSEYPAPDAEINLRALTTMNRAFGLPIGYSDHSLGSEAALMSVALGAKIIEKHFTLDKNMDGPDHKASSSPEELKAYIHSIRRAELMLGNGRKYPTKTEAENLPGIRRGIVAAKEIKSGTTLSREDLTFKRPYRGIEPKQIEDLIGMQINRDLAEDEPVVWEDLR